MSVVRGSQEDSAQLARDQAREEVAARWREQEGRGHAKNRSDRSEDDNEDEPRDPATHQNG